MTRDRSGTEAITLRVRPIPADTLTPVRAFLALTAPGEDAILLESVAGGESQARFSFLGYSPLAVWTSGNAVRDVFADLSGWLGSLPNPGEACGLPFLGGAVGWMDFSAFGLAEPASEKSFPGARASRMTFAGFSSGVVFDHLHQTCHLYAAGRSAEETGGVFAAMEAALAAPLPPARPASFTRRRSPDRERFSRNFAEVKERILAGDAYQVVLSEPFEGDFRGDPFAVYRGLRRLNPSPYHFYVSIGGRQVVGASPEMLLRTEGGRLTTVPIAGTRPRGASPDEDAALERDLLSDPKELAEHAMLVDLARNDLGRVCRHGSVRVAVRHSVERFSHVMHLTSVVEGDLAPGFTSLQALRHAFPAGTVSGAPKIRAVEILSGLEGEDRGIYGGAVGILDAGGDLETCIAIRTVEFSGGVARFRAGAGIVADSVEEAEWKEIHHKAGALLASLGETP
jgi:anthranilate synthase component 1